MLSHLIYVSTRTASCTDQEISNILQSCRKNNGKVDITGVLICSDTKFVQYLEGNYKDIIGLYDKIKSDTRHKNPVLISSSAIKERLFPSWEMGVKQLNNEVEFQTTLNEAEKKTFQAILSGKEQESHQAAKLISRFFKQA